MFSRVKMARAHSLSKISHKKSHFAMTNSTQQDELPEGSQHAMQKPVAIQEPTMFVAVVDYYIQSWEHMDKHSNELKLRFVAIQFACHFRDLARARQICRHQLCSKSSRQLNRNSSCIIDSARDPT